MTPLGDEHSSIELERYCASDIDVVNAARVSFGKQVQIMSDADVGLINYLMKNEHGTPFEHNFFKFRIMAPLFVFREWHRHRIGWSYNEMSARYVEMPATWYVPEPENVRVRVGKPGHYAYAPASPEDAYVYCTKLSEDCRESYKKYKQEIDKGIAPELARAFLHVNHYSEMIASCNARSLMHFLHLRWALTAQWEIQQYAKAISEYFFVMMPYTYNAFVANDKRAP